MGELNPKRVLIAVVATVFLAVIYFLLTIPSSTGRFNAERLVDAIQNYAEDRRNQGLPLPDTISTTQLLGLGFLDQNDIDALDGQELIVNLKTDETRPGEILIHSKRDGKIGNVTLSDGSVQAVNPQRAAPQP